MCHPFSSFCDDFYLNTRLGSQLALPHQRETVLHFFERIQKEFPGLSRFRKNEDGELMLEEERSNNSYRWLSLESRRLCCGHVNPESTADALRLHQLMLEMAPCHLGISPIEIDYLDVLMGFDMSFSGNHDEIIAETLLNDSPLNCLAEEAGARPIDYQPTITVALSEDCRLQARIDIVTRTNSYQVRTGEYNDDLISIYLIVRRYWGDKPRQPLEQMVVELAQRAEALAESYVAPRILRPLNSAIASRS